MHPLIRDNIRGEFIRDPIFRGPCAPNPEPCDSDENLFLFCAQTGVLTVSEAGGRLPFESVCSFTSGAFRHCRGEFRAICGGTYLVFVKLNVPANDTLTTRLMLEINGEEVAGAAINIQKSNTGSSAVFSFDTVISIDGDDIVSVNSTQPFTLTGNETLASILLLRVD